MHGKGIHQLYTIHTEVSTTILQHFNIESLHYNLLIDEDLLRAMEPTVRAGDTQLVRRLPVISEAYLNPESVRLKKLQESTVAAIAQLTDNPWTGMPN